MDLQWSFMVRDLTRVAPRTRGKLLDVGCGCRPFEDIFTPYVDEYIGLEMGSAFAETSAASHVRKPDLYYDGETIPFEDESFDTVMSIQVLEHTPEPQRLLGEMARILKRDGLMVLSAPFCFRLHEEPHDYYRYSIHGLTHMCRRAGLEIVEVRSQGSLWSVIGHKVNSYLAFQVADMAAVMQALGKLTHESESAHSGRVLLAPAVVPAMVFISAAARVLDRIAPDETETLSHLVLARRLPR